MRRYTYKFAGHPACTSSKSILALFNTSVSVVYCRSRVGSHTKEVVCLQGSVSQALSLAREIRPREASFGLLAHVCQVTADRRKRHHRRVPLSRCQFLFGNASLAKLSPLSVHHYGANFMLFWVTLVTMQVAACDTDNHVLLFKHSVVEAQPPASVEDSYVAHEVRSSFVTAMPALLV